METYAYRDVCAIIVNWRSGDDVSRLIAKLVAQHDHLLSIVVVDNSGELEGPQLQPAILAVAPENLGYGAGVNLGLAEAAKRGFRWAWLLNPDCEPTDDALAHLWCAAECHPKAVGFGPRQSVEDNVWTTYPSAARRNQWKVTPVVCVGCADGIHSVDIITGTGLLVRIPACLEVGCFDEAYFHYKEEFDLCRRIRDRGSIHLVCAAHVLHRRGGSLAQASPRAHYYRHRNELLYIAKFAKSRADRFKQSTKWIIRSLAAGRKAEKPSRHAIGEGLRDGLLRRGGPYDQARG